VALDLGDVTEAADRDAVEAPVERAGNALCDRRLSDTGRADEAENLALDGAAQLADGKELKDPVLDVGQAVVVLVEDLDRRRNRE
jgi:hypothetical protein